MTETAIRDAIGRTVISSERRAHIQAAFQAVPPGARAALLIISDDSGETRAHFAGNLNGNWKVAGGAGFDWKSKRPSRRWISENRRRWMRRS